MHQENKRFLTQNKIMLKLKQAFKSNTHNLSTIKMYRTVLSSGDDKRAQAINSKIGYHMEYQETLKENKTDDFNGTKKTQKQLRISEENSNKKALQSFLIMT